MATTVPAPHTALQAPPASVSRSDGLTEFGLLIDWIDTDHDHLPASVRRFIGNDAALRTDLARFQLLRAWLCGDCPAAGGCA